MSISEWAKTTGISYRTAWRMVRHGRLPVGIRAERLPTGTIRLHPGLFSLEKLGADLQEEAVIYARINPRQQRDLLDRQVDLCRTFCAAKGWKIKETIREVAPAVGARKKLCRLLTAPPRRVVILSRTIISRFDYALLHTCLGAARCQIIVIDESEVREGADGALEDLVDAISLVCHRHYGFKRGNLLIEEFMKLLRNGRKTE